MNKINWNNFLSSEYWLAGLTDGSNYTPVINEDGFFFWFFIYFFLSLAFFGIALRVYQAFLLDSHPFQKKFPVWGNNLISLGLLGEIWFLSRQVGVYLLGSRIWLFVFGIWLLILFYLVLKYFITMHKLEMIIFKNSIQK